METIDLKIHTVKVDAKVGFPTDFLWDNFALPVGINTEVNDDYIR